MNYLFIFFILGTGIEGNWVIDRLAKSSMKQISHPPNADLYQYM